MTEKKFLEIEEKLKTLKELIRNLGILETIYKLTKSKEKQKTQLTIGLNIGDDFFYSELELNKENILDSIDFQKIISRKTKDVLELKEEFLKL
jgi:hypothetical protein